MSISHVKLCICVGGKDEKDEEGGLTRMVPLEPTVTKVQPVIANNSLMQGSRADLSFCYPNNSVPRKSKKCKKVLLPSLVRNFLVSQWWIIWSWVLEVSADHSKPEPVQDYPKTEVGLGGLARVSLVLDRQLGGTTSFRSRVVWPFEKSRKPNGLVIPCLWKYFDVHLSHFLEIQLTQAEHSGLPGESPSSYLPLQVTLKPENSPKIRKKTLNWDKI